MVSEEGRKYLEFLRSTPSFGENGFDFEGLRLGMKSRREPSDPAVVCIPATVEGLPAEWVLAPGADPSARLLYLHGGGYISGSGAFYLPLAAHLSAASGCAVLLLDYRLAPECPFPAAVEDCVSAQQWLKGNGPDGPAPARVTFVAGDSAGGGLTLATLLASRDRGLPNASAAIPISPWTDLTLSGESIRTEEGSDPIMHPRALPDFVAMYVAERDLRHSLASPLFADFTGLPPLLIQVGQYEVIRDDSVRLAERAKAAGVEVTLEVWEGMFHVFQSHEPLLPEARAAFAHAGEFLRRHGA